MCFALNNATSKEALDFSSIMSIVFKSEIDIFLLRLAVNHNILIAFDTVQDGGRRWEARWGPCWCIKDVHLDPSHVVNGEVFVNLESECAAVFLC